MSYSTSKLFYILLISSLTFTSCDCWNDPDCHWEDSLKDYFQEIPKGELEIKIQNNGCDVDIYYSKKTGSCSEMEFSKTLFKGNSFVVRIKDSETLFYSSYEKGQEKCIGRYRTDYGTVMRKKTSKEKDTFIQILNSHYCGF